MGVLVTLADARAVQYCSQGLRDTCTQYGLSWDKFIKEGYDADELRQLDDAMINKVIEIAEERERCQGRPAAASLGTSIT